MAEILRDGPTLSELESEVVEKLMSRFTSAAITAHRPQQRSEEEQRGTACRAPPELHPHRPCPTQSSVLGSLVSGVSQSNSHQGNLPCASRRWNVIRLTGYCSAAKRDAKFSMRCLKA